MEEIDVDLFAGGGGVSEGLRLATGRGPHIAINHSRDAIACHTINHPECEHYLSDVYAVSPVEACRGRRVRALWLSPDCKHHSKAKGGKPLDRNIRDLAWIAFKWIEELPEHQRPRVVGLENVSEFQDWGPLDEHGRPIPERKGETFRAFLARFRANGYAAEYRVLCCADHNCPTIRKRLVLQARRDGRPILWPEPTHYKKPKPGQAPWRAAAECIDWDIPCPSIFLTREDARVIGVKRPLAENTLKRIARGVQRYVLDAPTPFIVGLGGRMGQTLERPTTGPFQTLTVKADSAVVVPYLTPITHHAAARVHDINEPVRTVTGAHRGEFALVAPHLMMMRNAQKPFNGADEPTHTITAGGAHLHLVAAFLAQHNAGPSYEAGGHAGKSAADPISTVTASGAQQGVVAAHLMSMKGSDRRAQDMRDPSPAITAGGGHAAAVCAFMVKYYGSAFAAPVDDPAHTITTLPRFGLVTVTIAGVPYLVVDIGIRMLTPRELFRAQSFPETYVIDTRPDGSKMSKATQIAHAGNAVPPEFAKAIWRCLLDLDASQDVREAA